MVPIFIPHLLSPRWHPRRYRPGGLGNWSGHTPFACDLIASLRPSVLVELGVQYGESYFAFCQAVAETGIHCKAYAVDSWLGDQHTGEYGEDVFEGVRAHNREFYESFSQLVRTSFDEAAGLFGPESIDLLHIDGVHTYAGVQHDFETWFPKLKRGGIVLLHDTAVRVNEFEVWRFWAEIREVYPSFEFDHSCGLGVLLKAGAAPREGIGSILFEPGGEIAGEEIRQYYELCADRLDYKYRFETATARDTWELTTQVLWRSSGEDFSESHSASIHHTIGTGESKIRLKVPRMPRPPCTIRLDISDRPLLLCINRISILDAYAKETSRLSLDQLPKQFHSNDMQYLDERASGEGIRVNLIGSDPSTFLAVEDNALEALAQGGFIEIVMSGLDVSTCLAALREDIARAEERIAAHQTELRKVREVLAARESELADLSARLAAIERSWAWHIVRPLVRFGNETDRSALSKRD